MSQAYALRALYERGPLPMGELAEALRLSVSTMTRVVDQLVRKRLVERAREDADRRVCRVRLRHRGRVLWERIHAELVEGDREVLRELSPREREVVIRVMGRLSEAVDAWRARREEREA